MIPTVTVDQMREVDRLMVEEVHIELILMMENAGRCLAQHVRSELDGDARGRRITVLAGSGGNGAGGLAAARRLAIWGAEVTVLLGQEIESMRGALPKVGLLRPEARPFVGRLYLADIAVPQLVYDRLGISVGSIFHESDIVPMISAG